MIPSIDLSICLLVSALFTSALAADDQDAFDLSFYRKGAAIGDSYAAGIGAGNQIDWGCSRYDGSYANLVSLQLGVNQDDLDFTYTACSGAVVDDISKQAKALPSGQEFVIVSAGGNDAKLVDILNSCVYSFLGGFSHPNCDSVLKNSRSIIESSEFASKLDGLLHLVISKLSPGGNVYYVGYAKFFDTTDNSCDKVSWHFWLNLFTREYLSKDRRENMNSLVEAMNGVLSSAIERAGPQVHFIDYDNDVAVSRGRYCQPAQDENGGNGANLIDLFFYQVETEDTPWLDPDPHQKRSLIQEDNLRPINDTLGGMYGALIQAAIEESDRDEGIGYAAVQDDNANLDLESEVDEVESQSKLSTRLIRDSSVAESDRRKPRGISWNTTLGHTSSQLTFRNGSNIPALGAKIVIEGADTSTSFAAGRTNMHFINSTTHSNSTSTGTVISNHTHVLLGSGRAVARFNIKKLLVSDKTSRVFHLTQGGHALVANMILYQMAADNAQRLGIGSILPMRVNTTGKGWPELPGAACSTDTYSKDTSDTWSSRDAMTSAILEFCADPRNTKGSKGQLTSGTFGSDFDYMNISISWENDRTAISEHTCSTWLDIVTDGCDIPDAGSENDKHGGVILYGSPKMNASLKIQPLVVRRIWDGGQVDARQCNDVGTNRYLDQGTLQSNIDDYCEKSANQNIAEADSLFSQIYNDGTPDRVALSTQWPPGPRNYQVFKEECQYYMSILNNGCSLPGDNNQMNWKHGGSMSDNNGITYKIDPTQNRPPPPVSPVGTCSAPVPFPWVYYAVTISGGGWLNSDNGQALRKQIEGCGAITHWVFKYFDEPRADGTEWEATCTLTLAISSHCVRKAVRSAGGFVNDQC